jgi:hypothetical protein
METWGSFGESSTGTATTPISLAQVISQVCSDKKVGQEQDRVASQKAMEELMLTKKTLQGELEVQAVRKIQATFRKFMHKKIRAIKNIQWMTGSNGNYVLPSLKHTDFCLIPTGQLKTKGIMPMGGELGYGIKLDGVNQHGLSGVKPSYFNVAWSYANLVNTPISIKETKFIQTLENDIIRLTKKGLVKGFDIGSPGILNWINCTILSLRQVNEGVYQQKFAKTLHLLLSLINIDRLWYTLNELKRVKQVIEGKLTNLNVNPHVRHFFYEDMFTHGYLPEQLLFLGINKPENKKLKDEILMMLSKIEESFERERYIFRMAVTYGPRFKFSDQEIKEMNEVNTYPIIFSSTHKLPIDSKLGNSNLGEQVYKGNLRLGEELDLIITDGKHQNILRQYLRSHKLRGKVFVCTEKDYLKICKLQ